MPYNNKTKTPFIKLYIKGYYKTSNDFLNVNKEKVYRSVIELYKGFLTNKKKTLTLYIQAMIVGNEWDVEYTYSRNNTKVLDEIIIPYFMNIEDYETCTEILQLKKNL